MNVIARIKNASLYPLAYSTVASQSVIARAKAFGKKPVIHFQKAYAGEKILLITLYEKGRLRPDILNLLETAKAAGLYVVAVNTLKVLQPESLQDRIDCYIERPNFGRDFGSYQTGFLHLFKQGWETQCPRLLMVNDSLFFSKKHLAVFLQQMTNTDIEVLGATENHEIEHHLGSFCISFNANVLQHTRFKNYWKRYASTDVRPKVIKRGEMKLSKTLRRCVSSSDQFQALFDLNWLAEHIKNHEELLNRVSDFYRVSDFVDWRRPSLKAAAGRFMNKFLHIDPGFANIEANIEAKTIYFVDNPKGLIKAVETSVKESNLQNLPKRVYEEVKNDLLECFTSGSQIHQNGILLHHLGLPIIKLDALYRGMFSIEDVDKVSGQLSPDEKQYFRKLMYSKPFGGNTLSGWKRAAFYRGLI